MSPCRYSLYRYGISLNKLFSYFASGKPTVFSGRVINDMVQRGERESPSPEDPQAIAQAILTLKGDGALAAEIPAGAQYVEEFYSIPVLADKLSNVGGACGENNRSQGAGQ